MKISYFLLSISLVLISHSVFGQNFYNKTTIQTIQIYFAQSNWDVLLDNLAQSTEDYLLADSVRINGITYDSVGVKYKGNSSYNPNNNKNPLHIKLDWVNSNRDYQGYTDIKLQNLYRDPSMIREVLSYAILENYMDCSKSNFANVYINGALRGLYSNAESIDDKFNTDHYYDHNGSFFKCNPVGGAGPGTTISPDLKYINNDSTSYYSGYELQSNYGWTDLVSMINTLNNNFVQIEDELDIDRAIWMLAFNNVLINLDSYSGAFKQNYYLYKDLNSRFVPTVWDLNMSFNGFPGGTGTGSGSATLDPMSNSTSNNHPLIKKIQGNPMYKRMYMAHVRTMLQEMFSSQWYLNQANILRTTIDASVQADPFKFYTYSQFQNSLLVDVVSGNQTISAIQTLMTNRVNYFLTNSNYLLVAPNILSQSVSNPNPSYNENIYLMATTSNENAVFLGYRTNHELRFTRTQMFDDGAHNDGTAGDHVFGVQVQANGPIFEYYIYAENSNAGLFSPQRAEHEFHVLDMNIAAPQPGQVQINEVMSSNDLTQEDPYGESNDWIELHNTTGNAIDVTGFYVSDDAGLPFKWQFPSSSVILPNGYLIIWADNDTIQTTGLHSNFKLGSSGDYLVLSNSTAALENLTIPALGTDISYARCPETGVIFDFATPTFNAMNNCVATIEEVEDVHLLIYPNPFNDGITISNPFENKGQIKIFDIQGRSVYEGFLQNAKQEIGSNEWKPGIYQVQVVFDNLEVQSIKIVKI